MADHDHNTVPETLAFLNPCCYERCTDTQALEILVYCKRCKGNSRDLHSTGNNADRAEQDMTDNPVSMNGNKGEFGIDIPVVAKGIHEPCLAILPKCLEMHLKNCGNIFRQFLPNTKGIHPVLYVARAYKAGVFGCAW